jgi:hypothetical protein
MKVSGHPYGPVVLSLPNSTRYPLYRNPHGAAAHFDAVARIMSLRPTEDRTRILCGPCNDFKPLRSFSYK